jgi:hypothetical protein
VETETAIIEYGSEEKVMAENSTFHAIKLGSKMTFEDQWLLFFHKPDVRDCASLNWMLSQ